MKTLFLVLVLALGGQFIFHVPAPPSGGDTSTACADAQAGGTVRYVRQGASGSNTGLDWTNAHTDIPTPVRGRTYCIADGTYSNGLFDTATSGTTLITIKKATVADHGTSTGWSDAFGDGVAAMSTWVFTTSYWTVDGAVGGGPGSWNTGHGFTLFSSSSILITFTGSVNHITLRHFGADSDRGSTFIAGLKGTTGTVSDITISSCAITEVFGPIFHIGNWSNSTIEYCYLYWNKNTAEDHSELVSSIGTNTNITWRYNIMDRIEGTAVFAGVNVGTSDDWHIYGNIIARHNATPLYYYCEIPGTNQQTMTGLRFYNNTIVGGSGMSQGAVMIESGCDSTDNEVKNNIWYNNDANSFNIGNATDTHNFASDNIRTEGCDPTPCDKDSEVLAGGNGQDSSGSPFVSYNADPLVANLHLASGTNAGVTLSSPYTSDLDGVTRAVDGTWDRGAFEFDASPPPPLLSVHRLIQRVWHGLY